MYFICMYIYTCTTHNHVLVKVEIKLLTYYITPNLEELKKGL